MYAVPRNYRNNLFYISIFLQAFTIVKNRLLFFKGVKIVEIHINILTEKGNLTVGQQAAPSIQKKGCHG
jgi:hypothetical protein